MDINPVGGTYSAYNPPRPRCHGEPEINKYNNNDNNHSNSNNDHTNDSNHNNDMLVLHTPCIPVSMSALSFKAGGVMNLLVEDGVSERTQH